MHSTAAALSLKRARITFDTTTTGTAPIDDPGEASPLVPHVDAHVRAASVARLRRHRQPWKTDPTPPASVAASVERQRHASSANLVTKSSSSSTVSPFHPPAPQSLVSLLQTDTDQGTPTTDTNSTTGTTILTMKAPSISSSLSIPTPTWHAPWKLATVVSSHLGWVRSIAMDPTNVMFATGSVDRTIKLWDFAQASAGADNALKLTLTGHLSAIRGLAFSDRHPYLFSAGEDKMVKCWDLETNQVVRHYHGHLSGIYCLKLHPTLDVLVTAGRDAVARVWDMRTKTQVHVLSGHEHTISSILTASTHPQITTGSHDSTVKLWDLAAGKCVSTLTHHSKSVRALCAAPPALGERTFCSASADSMRKWQCKNGRLLHKLSSSSGHSDTSIINALAIQDDGVLVSGGDDGTMRFWDYATGHCFQQQIATVQPGSLQQAENGIMALQFDLTGTRLITGETDKSIKIWKQDEQASELTHPIDMKAWRKECIAKSKERF